MKIAPQTVVTLKFTMTDVEGNILDQSQDGLFRYVHGTGRILPGLERALAGKAPGDNVDIELQPADAFGEYVSGLVEIAPRKLFKGLDVKPGMEFVTNSPRERSIPLRVVKVEGDDIYIDANHPLAGVALYFNVDVVDVRPASTSEIAAGRVSPRDRD